ncbi:MAG TPA: hypothetical protein VJV03_06380 [Pyrinomonadaceae bacterium]|nr:hypothetical protein [Pyrinomonadaceae bacterium]
MRASELFLNALMGISCSGFVFFAHLSAIGLIIAVIKKLRKTGGWPNIVIYVVKTGTALLLLVGLYLVSDKVPFRAVIFWSAALAVPFFFSLFYLFYLSKIESLSAISKSFVTTVVTQIRVAINRNV